MILFDQPSTPRRSVRLDTLLRLRWLAVAGQVVALFAVEFGFGFELPLLDCLAIVAI